MDNAQTFLITREHNPTNQPTVEYEQADIGYWLPDNMFTL
ncbi:hypothetical protein T01_10077 [Trichinella spiralis]|uniref:Uncharacterized protein n=1 Tax=Trichinella spiralis TaxID=6334 RepID=A0A0V1BQ80_TRISP|nr:hypothetical protein T01_10077 [Trichinella spiralis]